VPDADANPLQDFFDRYGEAWESHDPDRIAALHAEDGVFCLHGGGDDVRGREAIRETFAGFLEQWPDLHFEPVRIRFGEDFYAAEWRMSGTMAAPVEIGDAIAEPTGTRVEVDAVDVIVVRDGLVERKDTYVDAVSLQAQLAEAAKLQAAA
jgi:steroid delta-isomerase-like uncharacterized protein